MTTSQLLLNAWDWEPSIVAGCAGLILLYSWVLRWKLDRRAFYFVAGVLLLLLALVSPIDTLGDTYLLSAHMVQHLLLALGVPPLLLLGIPPEAARRAVAIPVVSKVERVLDRPGVAWAIGIGAMALWHTPPLFNAALANETLHIFQHLCFLVSGTIFWWVIVSPLESSRLAPVPWAFAYLFTACLGCTLIGVALTFSPASIYPSYLNPHGSAAILSLVRDQWGLSPGADHETGGLLMWTIGCSVYLCSSMAMFGRWYSMPEKEAAELPA